MKLVEVVNKDLPIGTSMKKLRKNFREKIETNENESKDDK